MTYATTSATGRSASHARASGPGRSRRRELGGVVVGVVAIAASLIATSVLLTAVCVMSASRHSVGRARMPMGAETVVRADLYGRRVGAIDLSGSHRLVIDTPDQPDLAHDRQDAHGRSAPIEAGACGEGRRSFLHWGGKSLTSRCASPPVPVAADFFLAGDVTLPDRRA